MITVVTTRFNKETLVSNYNYRLFQNSKRFPIILGTKKLLFKSVALNINFVLGINQAFWSVYKGPFTNISKHGLLCFPLQQERRLSCSSTIYVTSFSSISYHRNSATAFKFNWEQITWSRE